MTDCLSEKWVLVLKSLKTTHLYDHKSKWERLFTWKTGKNILKTGCGFEKAFLLEKVGWKLVPFKFFSRKNFIKVPSK